MNHSNISNVNDEIEIVQEELLKEDEEIKEDKESIEKETNILTKPQTMEEKEEKEEKKEKEQSQEFIYNLINNSEKMKLLQEANKALHISNTSLNKIIFVYSKPKVGSTSLITSLRIFASHIFNIIHIHDEEMLKILGNINNITVNEIILYNKIIGNEVYVIDVYRTPIERKLSTFFEKIETLHFNTSCEKLSTYPIERIIERFNKIFPYIGNGDNFLDIFNISKPLAFNVEDKYVYVESNGIKYIKLRLQDSEVWGEILTKLLNQEIKIIKDYETMNKPIKSIYLQFKNNYKIPRNFIEDIKECTYFHYYLSKKEREQYINQWTAKSSNITIPFTLEEFKFYEYISIENNNNLAIVQTKHYLDEGCLCKACQMKRMNIMNKILQGETSIKGIYHEEAKTEFIEQRIKRMNDMIQIRTRSNKISMKDTKNGISRMKSIVGLR